MTPSRRQTDEDTSDYRSQRGGALGMESQSKWLIAAVISTLLGLASWGLTTDHANLVSRMTALDAEHREFRAAITALIANQAEARAAREEVVRRLESIDRKLTRPSR